MWLERLERTLKPEDSESFRAWLSVALHRMVIVKRCQLWHGPEILGLLGELFLIDEVLPKRRLPVERIVLAVFLAVSAVGLCTMLVLWSRTSDLRDPRRTEEVYRTPVGSPREISLPDGGKMTINMSSHVRVSYGPTYRDIFLLTGEATFQVAEDPSRSFRVHAAGRSFEVETEPSEFNLRHLTTENLELIAMRGQVNANPNKGISRLTPAQIRARVGQGKHTFTAFEGALLGPDWYSVTKLQVPDVERRLAWHHGRIVLIDETLEDAVAEIGRYTNTEFVFSNDHLRHLRRSADLRIGDVDGLVRLLRDTLHIDSHRDSNHRMVLSPMTQPPSRSKAI